MFKDLWAHVVGGAGEGGGHVIGSHEDTRDAKVSKLDQIVAEKYVPGSATKNKTKQMRDQSVSMAILCPCGRSGPKGDWIRGSHTVSTPEMRSPL